MPTFTGLPPMTDDGADTLFGDLSPAQTPEQVVAQRPPESPEPQEARMPDEEGPSAQGPEEVSPADQPSALPPSAAEQADEPIPREAYEQLKRRYEGLRNFRGEALEAERARAEQAEQMLASLLAASTQTGISGEKLTELAARAEEAGMDPASVSIYADITRETVDARTKAQQEYLIAQVQAERARVEEAQAAAERELVSEFLEAHPDLTEDQRPKMARILYDIGAAYFADASGNELPEGLTYEQMLAAGSLRTFEPLSPEILEIAYEAVTSEGLATVLRALPPLHESDEGMQMARRLASNMLPSTQPARTTTQDIDRSLADAQTLSGPSAPAPAPEEELFVRPSAQTFFSK